MTAPTDPSIEEISGVSDLTFDLLSLLHNKLQAVAAMEIYKRDAKLAGHPHALEFISQCQESDREAILHLRALVSHELVIGLEGVGEAAMNAAGKIDAEPDERGVV